MHYGTEPFEQQQYGTAGVERVNLLLLPILPPPVSRWSCLDGDLLAANSAFATHSSDPRSAPRLKERHKQCARICVGCQPGRSVYPLSPSIF